LNTFKLLIDANQTISDCNQLMKKNKSVQGAMISLYKNRCNHSDNPYCINDNENCQFNVSTLETYLRDPYPKVINMSISWLSDYVNPRDLAKFYTSISE